MQEQELSRCVQPFHLPARNTFAVNLSESKGQMLLKLQLYNFVKSALCVLEVDDIYSLDTVSNWLIQVFVLDVWTCRPFGSFSITVNQTYV